MDQRVGIVTGGGRGIGRAVARALASDGAWVCVDDTGVDLDGSGGGPEAAASVVAEIEAAGGRAMASTLDARTPEAADKLVAEVEAWAGRKPNVVVHAAGTLRDGMVHKAADDDWSEVLASHLSVAVEITRALAGSMRDERWGRIVYIGGAAGLVGSAGQASYDVAKAGLFGLTRAVALEMAGRDVSVNYVAPFAYTRMTESIPPVNDVLRDYLDAAPGAVPDDIAPLISWLCSPDAQGVTGQVFSARGAVISLWSQPRPLEDLVDPLGFDQATLGDRLRPVLERHATPLQSEFDLFGGPPIPVDRPDSVRTPE